LVAAFGPVEAWPGRVVHRYPPTSERPIPTTPQSRKSKTPPPPPRQRPTPSTHKNSRSDRYCGSFFPSPFFPFFSVMQPLLPPDAWVGGHFGSKPPHLNFGGQPRKCSFFSTTRLSFPPPFTPPGFPGFQRTPPLFNYVNFHTDNISSTFPNNFRSMRTFDRSVRPL